MQASRALFGPTIYTLLKNKHKPLKPLISYGSWVKSNSVNMQALVVAREGAALTRPLTVALSSGDMLAVHGSNGSGKSTLLKTIAGLLPPGEGAVTVNEGVETPVLYLGHRLGLSPELTVYDNIVLWAGLHDAPELVGAALHYFELGDIANVPVGKLSAGWQQRVALTRLITVPSALWLLDEPTSNLDADGIILLQNLMESRLQQGGIIVVATHIALSGENIKTININKLNE